MKADTERRGQRWYSQKWVFSDMLELLGAMRFTGGSLRWCHDAMGYDIVNELNGIETRVKKFGDIKREALKVARGREQAAKEAEKEGHNIAARENYFAASITYGAARWSIWEEDNKELPELTEQIAYLYKKYSEYADHPVERVEIPFEGKILYGILHLPSNTTHRAPCLLSVPGMDTFKEQMVRLYGDKFLQRGIAVLALDGPGQGETLVKGLKVTVDNYERAGKVVMDYLRTRKDVEPEKIAMRGNSFGSYWCPKVLAYDSRFKAGVVHGICHEPGMKSLFNSAHPTYKERHMWMTGIYDEDEFDAQYASKLTLKGIGEQIRSPFLIFAGDDDALSPIEYTYEFYSELAGPKKLIVYEGGGHAITHPQYYNIMADFVQDALEGKPIRSEQLYVESSGKVVSR